MTTFAESLKANLEASPSLTRRGRSLLDLINSPKTKRRERILARLEDHAVVELKRQGWKGGTATARPLNWDAASINWPKLLETLLPILLALLKLFLV